MSQTELGGNIKSKDKLTTLPRGSNENPPREIFGGLKNAKSTQILCFIISRSSSPLQALVKVGAGVLKEMSFGYTGSWRGMAHSVGYQRVIAVVQRTPAEMAVHAVIASNSWAAVAEVDRPRVEVQAAVAVAAATSALDESAQVRS